MDSMIVLKMAAKHEKIYHIFARRWTITAKLVPEAIPKREGLGYVVSSRVPTGKEGQDQHSGLKMFVYEHIPTTTRRFSGTRKKFMMVDKT